ncbi:MAG: hypothetical protein ACRCYQ_16885 [Nocardioides sp.]
MNAYAMDMWLLMAGSFVVGSLISLACAVLLLPSARTLRGLGERGARHDAGSSAGSGES